MNLLKSFSLFAALVAGSCTSASMHPQEIDISRHYLFYLHGRIIEDEGPQPVDERFGLYDYRSVVEALGSRGAVVISELRPKGTDVGEYADRVVAEISRLLQAGVPESQIAVVGFSKGGAIALSASSRLKHPGLKFVLLATCGPWIEEVPALHLTGHVLSINETSDEMTTSCRPLADRSPQPQSFAERSITTGKGHGAFYLPRAEWLEPVLNRVHDDARQ
ncbi:MAG: alpha/beta hydrolase [Gammaproteobacteria bacterium]